MTHTNTHSHVAGIVCPVNVRCNTVRCQNAGRLGIQDIISQDIVDNVRILMYGDCDMQEQVKLLGLLLAEHDNVESSDIENKLLAQVQK